MLGLNENRINLCRKKSLNPESSSLCMNNLDYLVCRQESTHLTFFSLSALWKRVTAVIVEFITEQITIHNSTTTVAHFISSSMEQHSPLHTSLQYSRSVCLFFHAVLYPPNQCPMRFEWLALWSFLHSFLTCSI